MATLLFQCKEKEAYNESGDAVLMGKITTLMGTSLVLDINGTNHDIPLKDDGTFDFTLNVPKAGIYKLTHGQQGMFLLVYLQPGKKTTLKADGSNLVMSAKFEGDTKIENAFLTAKMINEPSLLNIDQTTFFTLPEEDFLNKVEEIKTKLIDFKKEFQKQNGVFNSYFEEIVNMDITFQATNLKMFYPQYYNYLMKSTDFVPSESFYSFFQSLDINNEINLNSEHFKVFVPLYLDHELKIKNASTALYESSGLDKLNILGEKITNQKIKDEVSFNIMKQSFETSLADAFDMYNLYMTQNLDTEKKKVIEALHNEWLPLKPGNVAPFFQGVDKNGKNFTSQSLQGKVLYIDVWATWCGPCIGELPHLENLQEKFKSNSNITFVSISIDQNKEPWRKMLVDKNMKGLQLYSEGAWNSEIISNYKINGIPRFIIIDKDGNLVDANALRPSNPNTADVLTKLL
ncbi:MAG: TlpA disulfide reductase family protein [Saprospiraceae bacterium]